MSEPSRPPPPRAYTPSRPKEGVQNDGEETSNDPPIPPRPPPEAIPREDEESDEPGPTRPQRKKSKGRGAGPPPPPVPYGKKTTESDGDKPKESNTRTDNVNVTQSLGPPKRQPPPTRPSKPPSGGPPRPSHAPVSTPAPVSSLPASKSKRSSREITIVSAQPMSSDVIPPPNTAVKNDQETTNSTSEKRKSLPSKRGPPPPKPVRPPPTTSSPDNETVPTPTTTAQQQPSTEESPDTHVKDPPPPSYPAPPPPSYPAPPPPPSSEEDVQYPPKPTSPAPPIPAERDKKKSSTVNPPPIPTPLDSVVQQGGVPTSTKETAVTETPPEPIVKKPMPPASGKAKPRKPFVATKQDNEENRTEVETKASNDSVEPVNTMAPSGNESSTNDTAGNEKQKVNGEEEQKQEKKPRKPAPKPPPSKKSMPAATSSSSTNITPSATDDVEKVQKPAQKSLPPRKAPPKPQPIKETAQSSTNLPKDESVTKTPPPQRTPPTRKGPPPPPTSQNSEKKSSPEMSAVKKSDGTFNTEQKRAPPPRKGPPAPPPQRSGNNETKSPNLGHKSPDVVVKARPSPPKPVKKDHPAPPLEQQQKSTRPPSNHPPSKGSPPVVTKTLAKSSGDNSSEPEPSKSKGSPPSPRSSPPSKPAPSQPSAAPRKTAPGKPTGPPKPGPPKPGPPKAEPGPPKAEPSKPSGGPPPPKPSGGPPPPKPSGGPPPSRPSGGPPPSRPSGGPSKPSGPPKPGPPKQAPNKPGPPKPGPPRPGPRTAGPKKPGGAPVPATRRTNQDVPPALPPRPTPGHPLYRYVCTEPHGIATNNKEAEEADELSYMEGDVIELIEKIDDYWFWARNADNDGAEGLIIAPDMKIIKRLPGEDKVAGFDDGPCAVAMSKFEAREGDELSFNEGDLIMLITRIGDGQWLRGRTMKGDEGIFPKAFVEIVEDLPPDAVEEPKSPASPEITDVPVGPYCVAVETFEAETPDDLSFKKGEVIILTERIDDSWLRGTVGGQTGMFPQVFVDVCVDIPVGVVKSNDKESSTSPVGVEVTAVFDFEGQSNDELTFKTGDKIRVTHRVSDEWVFGSLGWSEGMFPAAFIDTVPDNLPMKEEEKSEEQETAKSSSAPSGGSSEKSSADQKGNSTNAATGKCEAIYDFEAENEGELSFTTGEMIVTTEWVNDEWMVGNIGEERQGMFPLAFVKVINELPKVKEKVVEKKVSAQPSVKSKSGTSDDLLPKGVALSDFRPNDYSEIAVQTGDEVYLLSRETSSMYMGENIRTGDIGNFPIKIIEVITPLP